MIVEVPSTIGPYGAKPVGEPPVIPGGACIANAVRNAVGVRIAELPLTLGPVMQAIQCSRQLDQALRAWLCGVRVLNQRGGEHDLLADLLFEPHRLPW